MMNLNIYYFKPIINLKSSGFTSNPIRINLDKVTTIPIYYNSRMGSVQETGKFVSPNPFNGK